MFVGDNYGESIARLIIEGGTVSLGLNLGTLQPDPQGLNRTATALSALRQRRAAPPLFTGLYAVQNKRLRRMFEEKAGECPESFCIYGHGRTAGRTHGQSRILFVSPREEGQERNKCRVGFQLLLVSLVRCISFCYLFFFTVSKTALSPNNLYR